MKLTSIRTTIPALAAAVTGLACPVPAQAGGCGNFGIAFSFGSGGYCGPSWSVGFSSGGWGRPYYGGGYGCGIPAWRSCGYGGYGYGGYGYRGYGSGCYSYARPVGYAPGCAPPAPCVRYYPSWSTGVIITADSTDQSVPMSDGERQGIRTAAATPLKPFPTTARGATATASRPTPDLDRAWAALESSDPGAMAMFSQLVAADHEGGSPELGYAICAAAAGQAERAEWAARWALKQDPDALTKITRSDTLKTVAAAALARYEDKTRAQEPRGAKSFAVAVLNELAGEREQARSSSVLAGLGGDTDGSVTNLQRALGVAPDGSHEAAPAPRTETTLASAAPSAK